MNSVYRKKYRYGIDDLKEVHAFVYNDQGGSHKTNSIEEYNNSGGYLMYIFYDVPMTDEDIVKEVNNRKKWNENYILELKRSGTYGDIFYIDFEIEYDEILDAPSNSTTQSNEIFIDDITK